MKFFILRFLLFLLVSLNTQASWAADFRTVGWANAFLPGGGALLLGEPLQAGAQAAIEVGAFGIGYSLSEQHNIDLDGAITDQSFRGNSAEFLQEIGIKYHFMNVFNSYRQAYLVNASDEGQGIDQHTTTDLFKAPFNTEVLSEPTVWVPLAITAVAISIDYASQMKNLSPTQKFNTGTNFYTGLNQLVTYPIGSGVPEEMFYRGFLQNEFYHWVNSPFFSIPMSSLAFAFSHSPGLRWEAGLSGLYLGYLAYRNHGDLSSGIAVHFWSVVMLGVESLFLILHSQGSGAVPAAAQLNLSF